GGARSHRRAVRPPCATAERPMPVRYLSRVFRWQKPGLQAHNGPRGRGISTHAEIPRARPVVRFHFRTASVPRLLALVAAYYAAAKLGQALRYTGSVAALWPPVGLGIGALYLWGVELWPAIFVGDLIVNV